MESWLPFFVIVTALAVVLQMAILAAMYFQFRQMNERMTRIATDLHEKSVPILTRVHLLLEESQGKISGIVTDAAEVAHLARSQAQKVDRVFTEAVDRLRLQIIRADQILTGALEAVEDAGADLRRTIIVPVQHAAALIKGVKTGLDFLRARKNPAEKTGEQEEELFI